MNLLIRLPLAVANALAIVMIGSTAVALYQPPTTASQTIPLPSTPRPMKRPDNLCLGLNAYFEARGEGERGMAAVTQVAINRTARGYKGAKTACETVYLRKQFTWTHENPKMPTGEQLKEARDIARGVLAGRYINRVGSSLHYYNPHKVDAWWADSYAEVVTLGNHRFMR